MKPISQYDALLYEVGKLTFVQSVVYNALPKYQQWLIKNRYKRYLGFMEMKRLQDEENARWQKIAKSL